MFLPWNTNCITSCCCQDRVYVPQHEQHTVYDMGLVLFKDEVSNEVVIIDNHLTVT